jgi:hypothetical protein
MLRQLKGPADSNSSQRMSLTAPRNDTPSPRSGSLIIYAARFQPLHNGHVRDLEMVHNRLVDGMSLIIGVVTAAGETAEGPGIATTADEHFEASRNPWPSVVCCRAAARVASVLEQDRPKIPVIATLLPRPSRSWRVITTMLPGDRTWVIPEREEEHDERKAAFFVGQGDRLLRIPSPRIASGHEIRAAITAGSPRSADHLPLSVADLYLQSLHSRSLR